MTQLCVDFFLFFSLTPPPCFVEELLLSVLVYYFRVIYSSLMPEFMVDSRLFLCLTLILAYYFKGPIQNIGEIEMNYLM